jgi:glycosyltransferase involved in cell wall biosynthesis
VENSLRENGGLRVSLGHAQRLHAAGAATTVAVLQDVDDGPLARPHASLDVRMLSGRGTRFRTGAPAALARLVVHARAADVVVAGSEVGNCVLLGSLAARLARRPFAVLVQADLDDAVRTWVPRALRRATLRAHARADAAVCVAESLVPGIVGNGLPADRAHVVPNGIDVGAVRARAGLPMVPESGPAPHPPAAPGTGNGVPTVVANGRLTAAKDFPLLVRAHAQVLRAGVDHRLVIMGEGPDRPLIEDVVDELGVGSSVSLPGFVTEPFGRIAAADLFVLSSNTEGLPLTVLEALAVGAPVVSTRCGAGPDLLLDGGRFGELVPVGDVDALAVAIEAHLRDPGPLRAKALGGPRRALEFDAEHSSEQLLAVLAGLVPSARGQLPSEGTSRRAFPA